MYEILHSYSAKLLISAICCVNFFESSTQHFTEQTEECLLAKSCNHTWVPACGQDQHDFSYRLFLDECDMHEYSCQNREVFIKIKVTVCAQRCTKKNHHHKYENTCDCASQTLEKPNSCSCKEPLLATIITPTTPSVETTTDGKTEFPTVESTITYSDSSMTETTTENFETMTEFIEITNDTNENTTGATETNAIETTTENNATTIVDTTETGTEETNTGTTTEKSVNITTTTNITISHETTITEENNSTTTINDEKNNETTVASTTSHAPLTCNSDCFVPSTWETTPSNEKRDFIQILKGRYGDGVKVLRHTTHFAPVAVVPNIRSRFMFGRHKESFK